MNRRFFLSTASTALAARLMGASQTAEARPKHALKPDYTLRIEPCTLDIGHGVSIKTIGYNGQVPGPLLRMREGVPVCIDVLNQSANPEIVHWHGLAIDSLNDGAMEEGSPMIAPGSQLRYCFTPRPAGTRWYHTHVGGGANLAIGGYTGQFGFLLVDSAHDANLNAGHYDQEVFLAIHHWEPSFVPMVEAMWEQSANAPQTAGSDVGYRYATINQQMLGTGEPLRVKKGQRVLMRLLNASATENVVLALPGHTFKVIAMDGNPVPTPYAVETLALAVAERVDAIVEMNAPGVWVLGSTLEKSRSMGLGIVVEYSGESGPPVWRDPRPSVWDYSSFASSAKAPEPDETFVLTFRDIGQINGSQFDTWTINNRSWPDIEPIKVREGKRYRLVFRNGSGDQHPMHVHRHTFEVTRIGKKEMSGLRKDVVNVMPLDSVAVDFVADNPGDTLLHCHQALHMDFGFMQLIKYVS